MRQSSGAPTVGQSFVFRPPPAQAQPDALQPQLFIAGGPTTYPRNPAETVAASSDAVSRVVTYIRGITETVTAATDSPVRVVVFVRGPSETVPAATDAISRTALYTRAPVETVTASDSPTRQAPVLRTVSESITVTDSVGRTFTGARTIAETITATSDSVADLRVQVRAVAETITAASDAVSRIFTGTRVLAETVAGSSVVTRIANVIRALSETVTAATDAITRAVTYVRGPTETITSASDTVSALRLPGRLITETITAAADVVSRIFTGTRTITESTTVTDSVARHLVQARSLSETTTVTDAVVRHLVASRGVSETVPAAFDGVSRAPTFARLLTETVPATVDSIARALVVARQPVETIPAAADVVTIVYFPATGPAFVTPQMNDAAKFNALLADTFNLSVLLSDQASFRALLADLLGGLSAGNLVPNDHGQLGTNFNWSQSVYDAINAYQGNGTFKVTAQTVTVQSDVLLPVDITRRYLVSYLLKATTFVAGTHAYLGVAPYDADGLSIGSQHVMWIANTLTTLAADLHPGDTTITLTSAAGWLGSAAPTYQRAINVWDYVDGKGTHWPAQTYTRHVVANAWPVNGITGNVITLTTPWVGWGSVIPAGTPVSNGNAGGSFMYCTAVNVVVPAAWTQYQGIIAAGYGTGGNAPSNQWWPGTAQVKMLLLLNRDTSGNVTNFTDVGLLLPDTGPLMPALSDQPRYLVTLADAKREGG